MLQLWRQNLAASTAAAAQPSAPCLLPTLHACAPLQAQVVGIWFYDDADCDRISALLQRIASTFAAPSEAGVGAAVAETVAAPAPPAPMPAAAPAEGAEAGDTGFWDRRVTVPDDGSAVGAHPLQPATALLVPAQLQQPQAAAPEASASSSDLARLFAGIKVGGQTPAPPAAAPHVAAPPTMAPVMLLTPQLLQQEAGSHAAPAVAEPAADGAAPGNMLLQSLLRGSQQQQLPPTVAAPAQRPVDITGESWDFCVWRQRSTRGACPRVWPNGVPTDARPLSPVMPCAEAADRALCAKVSSLLSSLAHNDAFCGLLAAELKRAGLV